MAKTPVALLLAVLATAAPCPAQGGASALSPREVVSFKSGYSHLLYRVSAPPEAASLDVRLPSSIHGTLWIASPGGDVKSAIARAREAEGQRPVANMNELLRSLAGRDLALTLSQNQEIAQLSGKLAGILEHAPDAPSRHATTGSDFSLVIESDSGVHVIARNRVLGLSLPAGDRPLEATHSFTEKTNVLELGLREGRTEPSDIRVSAMATGLAWAPSYRLVLDGDSAGELSSNAIVINDLEDLAGARLRLAVGYPHLMFARIASPLSPSTTWDAFRNQILRASGQPGQQQNYDPILAQSLSNFARYTDQGGGGSNPEPAPGEASEDLYFWDMGRVDLKKGERAYFPLFRQRTKVVHRYDWDLPDRIGPRSDYQSQQDDKPIPAWHVLLIRNESDAPWTTAPVLIENERGPLAQSDLTYTPRGAETTVKLTQALDLAGESQEYRIGAATSERRIEHILGRNYERVTLEGKLSLRNRSGRAMPVRVRKDLSGNLIEAEHAPATSAAAERLGQVNVSQTLTWNVELGPGASWTASYRYEALIAR